MYLKSIEINGFKSFATKTKLEFLGPKNNRFSITAIVGPNGSGKSNIADALRWVMGEQSQKQLRGKKSDDVIFLGSAGKSKMSLASVSIVLDNSDKRADLDYDELVITRKIYRNGDNEYFINNNKVRLLDLQLLLAQAHFGTSSYSVIGQGAIDALLLQSSSDRKNFFNEAVGIKEFQIKRHQAYLKLNKTEENIKQAQLLLQEIEPRLKILRRQVKKIEQRQDLEMELNDLQSMYFFTRFSDLNIKIGNTETKITEIERKYQDKQKELLSTQQQLAILAKAKTRQEIFAELQLKYNRLLQEKNNLEKEKTILGGRLQVEFNKQGRQNVGWLKNKLSSFYQEKEKFKSELDLENTKKDSLKNEINDLNEKLNKINQDKENLEQKRIELNKKIQDLKSNQSNFNFNWQGLKAVQAILNNKDNFSGKIYGLVAQLARVNEEVKTAVEIAAQAHLASVVVENDQVAEQCIKFLRDNQLGVATFLPLNKIKPRFLPQDIDKYLNYTGVYGLANDLVEYNSIFDNIFSYVFGSTLVIKDIEVGRQIGIGKIRMVSLAGDILEVSGSMKGGFRRKNNFGLRFSSSDFFAEAKIDDYEKELTEINSRLQNFEREERVLLITLSELNARYQTTINKINLTEDKINEIKREILQLEQELKLATLNSDEYTDFVSDINRQISDLDEKIRQKQKEVYELEQKINNFNAEEEKKKKQVFALQDKMQILQTELNSILNDKNNLKMSLVKLQTYLEDLENDLYTELKLSLEQLKNKGVSSIPLVELEELKNRIEKIKYKLSLIGGIDEEVLKEYEEVKQKYDDLSLELNDLEKAAGDLRSLIVELDKLMKKKHNQAFKIIREEFKRYFKLLFAGGEADLIEIYDYEDNQANEEYQDVNLEKPNKRQRILVGIDIIASPPGKKVKNIQSLSGGERSMTSIALLCAILKVNPPPFIVLDEVEAALDEANTKRFTSILLELAKHSQFLLITHNRVTMQSADTLYGVTMGNDGVSKLLSVKLDDNLDK